MKNHSKKRVGIAVMVVALVLCVLLIMTNVYTADAATTSNKIADVNSNYQPTTGSRDEAIKASEEKNVQVAEEGFTLLKNNGALPLQQNAKVSVFGKNSVNPVYGGGGSGSVNTSTATTLMKGINEAGIATNPALEAFYNNTSASGAFAARPTGNAEPNGGILIGETPVSMYGAAGIESSYSNYNDAAIVVLSRIGGEGWDLPRTAYTTGTTTLKSGARPVVSGDKQHYLQLDQNETDLLEYVCDKFDNVVVVLNSSTQMELGFLDDTTHFAYQDNIKGALWVGGPGGHGFKALGRILNGKVNPSGRTVSTWARNFYDTPALQNFGNNGVSNGNTYRNVNGSTTSAPNGVYYDEGIYMDYLYYETRAYTESTATTPNANWHKNNVVYPFGYGLSYTTFEWSVNNASPANNGALTKDGKITINVNVKNTGEFAGKDVVQLYNSAPYINGQIEKAHVQLVDFVKTPIIAPGKTATVKLEVDVQDLASYDFADENNNTHTGYELDAGAYKLYIGKNANHAWAGTDNLTLNYTVPAGGFKYTTDKETGVEIVNQFDDVSSAMFGDYFPTTNAAGKYTFTGAKRSMSRSNFSGTFPKTPDAAVDYKITEGQLSFLWNSYNIGEGEANASAHSAALYAKYDAGKPWFVAADKMPIYRTTAMTQADKPMLLKELVGLEYEDAKWDTFMNQFTVLQMAGLVGVGMYNTAALPVFGVPAGHGGDGPAGFSNRGALNMGNNALTSGCIIGATWNKQLAYELGLAVGEEALWGTGSQTYSIWYAPGVNLHRTPFSGRNFEYYSADGLLSGYIGAGVVLGVREKGVITMLKHFFANDQETNRAQLYTFADEQVFRQLYLKPFEMGVKQGKTLGLMVSYNYVGNVYTGHSTPLLQNVTRGEWGFRGSVITDWGNAWQVANKMIRHGCDQMLNGTSYNPNTNDSAANGITIHENWLSATHVTAMRTSAKNILFTVANSNAMSDNAVAYRGRELPTAVKGKVYHPALSSTATFNPAYSVMPDAPFGASTIKYSIVDGALPAGLSFYTSNQTAPSNSMTGLITGTVSASAPAGVYKFIVKIESMDINKAGVSDIILSNRNTSNSLPSVAGDFTKSATAEFSITVVDAALADVTTGNFYYQPLGLLTGKTTGTYALKSGQSLPAGLSMAASGEIFGTPTKAGNTFFTVAFIPAGGTAEDAEDLGFAINVKDVDVTPGIPGENGEDGAKWLLGVVDPTEEGKVGDVYLNTLTWDLFAKDDDGNWSLIGNIKGAPGQTGPDGAAGENGGKGDKGDPGVGGEGCGSTFSIGGTLILLGFIVAACVIVLVTKRTKEKDKE